MTYINHWSKRVAIAALILAGLGLQACGDDDSGATPGDNGGTADSGDGGSSANAGKSGGSGGKKSGKPSTKDSGTDETKDGGKGGASDAGSDSGSGGDCTGTDDCYSCEPKTNEQILNHCTDATCQPYDNSKLTELGSGGKLPDLP